MPVRELERAGAGSGVSAITESRGVGTSRSQNLAVLDLLFLSKQIHRNNRVYRV